VNNEVFQDKVITVSETSHVMMSEKNGHETLTWH